MKKDTWIGTLTAVLALSAFASVVLFLFYYVPADRETRSLQAQVNGIMTRNNMMYMLVVDTVEYSKKNPAVDPLLEFVGAKPPKTAPATSTPATR